MEVSSPGEDSISVNSESLETILVDACSGDGANELEKIQRLDVVEQALIAHQMCSALKDGEEFFTQDKSFRKSKS